MSYGMQAMVARNIRHFGQNQTVTVRRRHRLTDSRGKGAADVLAVNATAAIGASTLAIKASSGTLKGVLPADFTLTVAGDATVYTVQAEAVVSTAGVLTVTLSPVLVAEAAEDAAVTLGADYIEGSFERMVSGFEAEDVGDVISGQSREVHLSAQGAPWTPLEGDVLTDTNETIARLRTIAPGAVVAGWSALVGG